MTTQQIEIIVILAITVGLFVWGRWRHDIVALAALLAAVVAGLVDADIAFLGFGHPAVITVAAVLVLSRGLQTTGAVDLLAQKVLPQGGGPRLAIMTLTALGALLSSFMNNVGAMALLMPIAIQAATKHGLPPGKVLMPLSFGTILGGMTTLIGTPPNLIVAGFRATTASGSFGMFDFTPIGLAVALAGVLFATLIGWRLVPTREQGDAASFDTGKYLTEARVLADGKADGQTLRAVERAMAEVDAQIVGMARNEFRVSAPNPRRVLKSGDVLVIEADPESLAKVLDDHGLALEAHESDGDRDAPTADAAPADADAQADAAKPEAHSDAETELQEFVVMPNSNLIGRSTADVQLRARYGLSVLAISRQGRRTFRRLRSTKLRAGDVVLVQGVPDALGGFASAFGAVPLARRDIGLAKRHGAGLASAIMALAIVAAATGLLAPAVAFVIGVVAFMAFKVLPLRLVYEAVDWPVIVLLAALIPVAGAMESTGAADVMARVLLDGAAQGRPIIALGLILVLAMTLSDFMNNAATAAVMCPIAISTASRLDASADAFLMAVAIGASCAFLTPIGHQNNTLILGPGGFRFSDYWRLGLPMEVLVVAISLPMLVWVWPL